ncbi:MAG: thioredoxin-dependent thiol peroxidase [Proteobacteria bacterium]|nr:thioredoxin-dependent thiol peroxidase [Pseudomonadota bacterium]
MTLTVGQHAPDFTLPDPKGTPVTLSALRGKYVVIYFYPKANTPGCTTQACSIRDEKSAFDKLNAVVLGISPDPVKNVAKFVSAQNLNFTLLADEDKTVVETYGVWVEKSMYGRTYMGAERTTFIVDPAGKIAAIFPKVKPGEHTALVTNWLKENGAVAA